MGRAGPPGVFPPAYKASLNWVPFYDREHYANGWTMRLNRVAYTLLSHIGKDALILDVGCGTGLLGRELRAYGFGNLQGIDISQPSLNILKRFLF